MGAYNRFLSMLSTEFHKYLMQNEAMADSIPANALVIFEVEGDDDFNRWNKTMSLRNQEKDQPIIMIHVKRWREHSAIEELHLARAHGSAKPADGFSAST